MAEGHEAVGLWRGYAGLAERSYVPLDIRAVSGILHLGGTILSTSSYDPFRHEDGVKRVTEAVEQDGFDAVVAIGGEHTMGITAGSTRITASHWWACRRRSTTTSPAPTTRSASTPPCRSRPTRSTACTRPPSHTTA